MNEQPNRAERRAEAKRLASGNSHVFEQASALRELADNVGWLIARGGKILFEAGPPESKVMLPNGGHHDDGRRIVKVSFAVAGPHGPIGGSTSVEIRADDVARAAGATGANLFMAALRAARAEAKKREEKKL